MLPGRHAPPLLPATAMTPTALQTAAKEARWTPAQALHGLRQKPQGSPAGAASLKQLLAFCGMDSSHAGKTQEMQLNSQTSPVTATPNTPFHPCTRLCHVPEAATTASLRISPLMLKHLSLPICDQVPLHAPSPSCPSWVQLVSSDDAFSHCFVRQQGCDTILRCAWTYRTPA